MVWKLCDSTGVAVAAVVRGRATERAEEDERAADRLPRLESMVQCSSASGTMPDLDIVEECW